LTEDATFFMSALVGANDRNIDSKLATNEGVVVGFKDSIVTIFGLESVMLNELIYFKGGASGLVLNLEFSVVRALVFGGNTSIIVGETVQSSGFVMRTPVGDMFLGRIVNPLGNPIDGHGNIKPASFMHIERKAPGVITRKKVFEPVITGVKVIDALVPIGRGQRELVLGDRKTGKTMLVIDSILNQKRTFSNHEFPLICVYVAIGKRKTEVNRL
jgi:F-type H+-transporting ATPase subunit alpha